MFDAIHAQLCRRQGVPLRLRIAEFQRQRVDGPGRAKEVIIGDVPEVGRASKAVVGALRRQGRVAE